MFITSPLERGDVDVIQANNLNGCPVAQVLILNTWLQDLHIALLSALF